MTIKYTHATLDDQAADLAGLPAPFPSTTDGGSSIGRESGGACQELSADVSKGEPEQDPKTKKPLRGKGLCRFIASPARNWNLTQVMEAAGLRFAKYLSRHKLFRVDDLWQFFQRSPLRFFTETRHTSRSN